jgi:hypothetical protein
MSRLVLLLTVLAVSVLPTRSQNSDPPAAHSGHDHTQMHAEPSQMMCKQMMADHVAEMKATSQTLATNLAQMKATLPLINDVNERSRWQSNIAMWQAVADHFSHLAEHAAHMQAMGMGCGMMMGHGAEDKPAAPAKTQ